jgi:hypothetical protein
MLRRFVDFSSCSDSVGIVQIFTNAASEGSFGETISETGFQRGHHYPTLAVLRFVPLAPWVSNGFGGVIADSLDAQPFDQVVASEFANAVRSRTRMPGQMMAMICATLR